MIEIKAPEDYSAVRDMKSIFLAGSIEMGKAANWQERVVAGLRHVEVLLLNPRRVDWDSSWAQSADNPNFRQQVEWELAAMEHADMIVMYFAPETRSPITLLELGLHSRDMPSKLVVCCPEGFWRKGNVDIVCERYGVRRVETLDDMVKLSVNWLQKAA